MLGLAYLGNLFVSPTLQACSKGVKHTVAKSAFFPPFHTVPCHPPS